MSIKQRLQKINDRINRVAASCGRNPDDVLLVAVSKRHSTSLIRKAYEAGQRHFGENYAQELRDKAKELACLKDIKWHFIGHLQNNKAKYAVGANALVETVDSVKLVNKLNDLSKKNKVKTKCLAQVNVGNEEQKSGCDAASLKAIIKNILESEHLILKGLMTIPPWDLDTETARVYFKKLSKLQNEHGGSDLLPHLSMGMSADFETAIEEGATIVRVGTAIFGEREY